MFQAAFCNNFVKIEVSRIKDNTEINKINVKNGQKLQNAKSKGLKFGGNAPILDANLYYDKPIQMNEQKLSCKNGKKWV